MGISEEDRERTYLSLFDQNNGWELPKAEKEMNNEFQRAQNTPLGMGKLGKSQICGTYTNSWAIESKKKSQGNWENIFRLMKIKQTTKTYEMQ